jgi:tetratricopeptide (TPR) repeat protein
MSAAAKPAMPDQVQTALGLRVVGRLQEALDVLVTPGANIRDFYTVRADLQFALCRYEEAAGSYFTVITSEPENAYAYLNFALCLRHLGRWAQAAEAFEKVLQFEPHRDEARLTLAACQLHLNRPQEALANFDRIWSDAARGPALFGKAVSLQLLRRFGEAAAAYERVLAADPNSEEVLSNLIALSIEAHELDDARRYSLRLLELRPQSTIALQGLAAVALERREFEAAVQYCGRIVERDSACVEAWHNLRFATGRIMSALKTPQAAPAAAGRR